MEAQALLSKVCDENRVDILKRYGIEPNHLTTNAERNAYRYIVNYAEENSGQTPDGAWLDAEIEEGFYFPTTMSFKHLANKVKDDAYFREVQNIFDDVALQQEFEQGNMEKFKELFEAKYKNIQKATLKTQKIAPDMEETKQSFYQEFLDRKAGKSHRLWKTPFEGLNKEIGGLFSSDVYGVLAESGRGKSYLLISMVDEMLRQGANVLVKSYELKSYAWLSRLFSIISAREEFFKDQQGQSVGLENKAILSAHMDVENEDKFMELLDNFNNYYEGELFLQAKGDDDLTRSLKDLDTELTQKPEVDVVVLDPFYGLSDVYGNNANKTKGGAAEQAARKFENLVGQHDVVGLYAVQAQVEKQKHQEDSEMPRELKLPTRDQTKTSKALLEICSNLFSFDSNDGEAALGVEKGRSGGEGFELQLLALLDVGVLREFSQGGDLPF